MRKKTIIAELAGPKSQLHSHFSGPGAQGGPVQSLTQALLFKSSQFHTQPITKSGHFAATWEGWHSRGRPERILSQSATYDYKGKVP